MKNIVWSLSIDDYLKIVERAKEMGIKPGESMAPALEEYYASKQGDAEILGTTECPDIDMLCGELRESNPKLKILNINEIKRRDNGNQN